MVILKYAKNVRRMHTKMVYIAKLRDEITLERVKKQVEDGWTCQIGIEKYLYNVHKIATDNKIKGYF